MQAMHERESDVNQVPCVKPLALVECGVLGSSQIKAD